MAVRVSPVDVTGQFDNVTGRHNLSLTLYHKRKGHEGHLFILQIDIISKDVVKGECEIF